MSKEKEVIIELLPQNKSGNDETKSLSNLSILKRRLLLANQRTMKNPKMEPSSSGSKPNDHMSYMNSGMLPIRISHRLCQVCHTIKPIADIVMLTDEVEKLFILLFAVFRKKIFIDATVRLYRQPALYTCYSHLAETSSEIITMFGVTNAVGIFRARQRKVSQIIKFVNHITGRLTEESRLLNLAYLFMVQYPEITAVVGPMMKAEDIPIEQTVECHTVESTNNIVPKCFRQPRKQRLENEEEGYSSSMLRIIKQEPLHLPTAPAPSYESDDEASPPQIISTPVQCCYCMEIREKDNLLYVAKTKYRLTQWVNRLGEEFGERLRSNVINYMCRRHFSKVDFSARGRLRRAAIPNVVPPPEIHTFKIKGNEFVKVPDEDLKDGQQADVDIDVEN